MQLQLRQPIQTIRTNVQKYRWQIVFGGILLAVLFWNRKDIVVTLSSLTDKAQWCQKLFKVVSAELPQIPTISKLIIVAQAAYESGYGRGNAAQAGNNFFNITAGPAWTGDSWVDVGGDTDGQGNLITQTWRKYPTVNDGVKDYWSFIGPTQNGGRYAAAQAALLNGDLNGFIYGLYNGGYFTLNPVTYLANMSAVVATVQNFVGLTSA